jgi:hypothetical protein
MRKGRYVIKFRRAPDHGEDPSEWGYYGGYKNGPGCFRFRLAIDARNQLDHLLASVGFPVFDGYEFYIEKMPHEKR